MIVVECVWRITLFCAHQQRIDPHCSPLCSTAQVQGSRPCPQMLPAPIVHSEDAPRPSQTSKPRVWMLTTRHPQVASNARLHASIQTYALTLTPVFKHTHACKLFRLCDVCTLLSCVVLLPGMTVTQTSEGTKITTVVVTSGGRNPARHELSYVDSKVSRVFALRVLVLSW